jgi:hypothetical protein
VHVTVVCIDDALQLVDNLITRMLAFSVKTYFIDDEHFENGGRCVRVAMTEI